MKKKSCDPNTLGKIKANWWNGSNNDFKSKKQKGLTNIFKILRKKLECLFCSRHVFGKDCHTKNYLGRTFKL